MNNQTWACASAFVFGVTILLAGCSGSPGHPASASASASAANAASASAHALQAPPAYAATPATGPNAKVDHRIDTLLGDHRAYREVFDRLQKALATDDKAGVAALVAYPLNLSLHGEPVQIRNAQELIKDWNQVVTPGLMRTVADQKFSRVFVNQDGVMLGNGQVWISGICRDESCSRSVVRITTIQPSVQ